MLHLEQTKEDRSSIVSALVRNTALTVMPKLAHYRAVFIRSCNNVNSLPGEAPLYMHLTHGFLYTGKHTDVHGDLLLLHNGKNTVYM